MSTSTIVNNVFNAVYDGLRARPVSHLAAATFLGTSIYVAHAGLASLPIGDLASVLTGLFVALAVLQWLALGRKESCLAEKDHDRADAVIHQAWMFGAIETVLYALGGLSLINAEGVAVYSLTGWSLAGIWASALAASALFAFANFRVKWVSCDAVHVRRQPPTDGGLHQQLFVGSADNVPVLEHVPADWSTDPKVIDFVARMHRAGKADDRDEAAKATAAKTPAERLRLAAKRIRTREWRERQRAVA